MNKIRHSAAMHKRSGEPMIGDASSRHPDEVSMHSSWIASAHSRSGSAATRHE